MSIDNPQKQLKKVLVIGAGAVGGYFGALLCRSGIDVTFLVRPKSHQSIAGGGLQIKSVNGDFTVHPPLIQSVSQIDSVDLIILAVKAYDLPSLLKEIAPLVERGATLLTLQNGVDSEERILSYFKRDCLVAGVAYITSRLAAPGSDRTLSTRHHLPRGALRREERSGRPNSSTPLRMPESPAT
ncbi:MAG: 2-dehydropantoate 2-reductase [Candidatus Manganitrophus sp.]|nr:2-dehydropantoate 2-reductase [Candidatus Manganitrophus sp.]